MKRLLDKLAIALICLAGFSMAESFAAPVAALLVSVAVSSAVQLYTGRKAASCIILLWAVMCGFQPIFFCALPLMLYDALWEKKWWLTLPSLTVLVRLDGLIYPQLIISAMGVTIAVIIYMRVSKLEETVNKLTSLRDEITEKNMQLAEQNLRLAEAQDNEVHLATLRERNRIAREIHDNVGHMLTRSILQSGALMVINKDNDLKEPLESLKSTLDSAMTSIRESVHDLHDDSIDLKKVIEESIRTVDSRFDVTLDHDAGENIPGRIKLCIAGVVKEGLSNAAKHSDGNKISIVVREHPGFYQLSLTDNGHPGKIKESGIGLKNMQERAESIGGRISFTADDSGFRIFMSIPKG
ncbi:MAG: sensor histidine kinase [Oscillospiraceae bacterium]|nr:sensor histidine kinase [Oscillospiraceae bacterium]